MAEVGIQPLSFKGFIVYLAVGLVLLIFQTTISPWLGPWGYAPDFTLLLIINLGLIAPLVKGALLVALLGFLKDASGGGSLGLNPFIFLLIFLAIGQVRQNLDPKTPGYLLLFIFVFALAGAGLAWFLVYILGEPLNFISSCRSGPFSVCLISAVGTALVGPIFFWAFDRLQPMIEAAPEEET